MNQRIKKASAINLNTLNVYIRILFTLYCGNVAGSPWSLAGNYGNWRYEAVFRQPTKL